MRWVSAVLGHELILDEQIDIRMRPSTQRTEGVNSLELDDQLAILFRGPHSILFRDPFFGAPSEQFRIGQERRDESIVLEVFIVVSDP